MDEFTLREELLKGEDSTRQFKRRFNWADDVAEEVVAFLNTRGGRIFIGVDDKDGSIVGVPSDQVDKQSQLIANACDNNLTPPASVLTENVTTSDGVVIVATIEEGVDKPYQTKKGGHFFVKKGADKRHVFNRSELQRLFQDAHTVYGEARIVAGSSIADLDVERFRDFYQTKYRKLLPPEEADLIRELTACRLAKDCCLTVAGIMLFGIHPQQQLPSFTTKAVWFRGTDRSGADYYDSRQFAGHLASQYEEAMAFLRRWCSRIQNGSFNAPSSVEIPEVVFEELLVNALVHRDYFINDSIKLFIFDDRIEIRSPGRLPNSLTIEEVRRGIRRDRNPVIQSFAYDLLNYRGLGSGVLRALQARPDIEFVEDVAGEEVLAIIPTQPFTATQKS